MSTILYNMLASPQQSRKSDLKHPDRVIAAPFQNVGHIQHKPHSLTKAESFRQVDFRSYSFPPLDPPSLVKLEKYCGPTTESNWVIPGVLLVGAYPASEDDTETFDLITGILKLGIRKFACLQLEYRDDVPAEQWRAGKGLRPYFQDVKHIVQNKTIYFPNCSVPIVDAQNLSFDHLPIVDCGVTDDDRVLQLCRKLVLDITRGEVIYLHCWGGHGRTGTVVSIMLHLMYGLSSAEAMARCQLVHDLRICPVNVGSPQTQTQRDQVSRIVADLQRQYRSEKIVYENSSDSLNSTVRVSRSGSTDYDEEKMVKNNQRGVNGGGSFTEGMKLSRNIHSFNFNSSGNNGSGAITHIGSPLPKANSHKNSSNGSGAPVTSSSAAVTSAALFTSVVVQDSVLERVPSAAGSSVKPLPAVNSAKNNNTSSSSTSNNAGNGSAASATDFHKTIPRPDSSFSPQKRGHSVHSLKEAERELSGVILPLDYSALSPASTFHRKAYEMESRSPTEQLEGINGSALKALSMRTPSSEDSHTQQQLPGVVVDNYTRNSLTPVNLEDLLVPDPSYERHLSTSSLPQGDRQLSTASQPMSISSEVSALDHRPPSAASSGGHSEGTIKRNISCTLATIDVATDFNDDNLSTQVRKASATNLNNHNFQQKEPVSQPSGGGGGVSSFSISQVLNVARQVLLNGGKSSPTSASVSASSSVVPSAPSGSSPRVSSVKTPTPPIGVAPSSSSRSSRNSRN